MTKSVRAFVVVGLAALLGASLLHVLVMAGVHHVWSALIHLTLFGWISAMILAVNYHTIPVFSGREFPYPWLLAAHVGIFSVGVTLAVGGLLAAWSFGYTVGLLLQMLAALLFVVKLLLLFLRGPRRAIGPPVPPTLQQRRLDRLATRATQGAGLCLPLALLLLIAQHLHWIGGAWLLAAEHLVTLGWIMLMIAGVAYHVLPRFSGHEVRSIAWARTQLQCHGIALVLIVLGLGFGWSRFFAAGGLLMGVGILLFIGTLWPTLRVLEPRSRAIPLTFRERP
jgi:hypothetical protein